MKEADLVIGNSSSGIIEAPCLGTPTVNLGLRQSGRLMAPSVITSFESCSEIDLALTKALSNEHKLLSKNRINPYGGPGAAKVMIEVLENIKLKGILHKKFYDFNYS